MMKKRTVVVEGGIAADPSGRVRMVYRSFHLLRGSAQHSRGGLTILERFNSGYHRFSVERIVSSHITKGERKEFGGST
jgi:hypothetical protein